MIESTFEYIKIELNNSNKTTSYQIIKNVCLIHSFSDYFKCSEMFKKFCIRLLRARNRYKFKIIQLIEVELAVLLAILVLFNQAQVLLILNNTFIQYVR